MTQQIAANLLIVLHVVAALGTAGHALLNKRDPRSAWAWIVVCWLMPLAGALLYFWFGVNRIERRARRELGAAPERPAHGHETVPDVPGLPVEVRELVRTGRIMSGLPLVPGNRVTPLHNGEEAYPDMLAAIARARRSVWLETYIFDADATGRQFAEALAAAQARGVQVRVLLDGIGHLSWRRPATGLLRELGVPFAKFLPPRWWPPMLHANLRNHHKLMTVDGEAAWVGGMNISDRHWVTRADEPVTDLHFRMEGPVAAQLEGVFAEVWRFAAGEKLACSTPAPVRGTTSCRAITDGPNDAVDRLQLVLLAAIANAHQRLCIMTPYFIPTRELSGALESAALRGVVIEIVLPRRSDQWWADCATRRWLTQLVGRSIQVYYRPGPFAHTKLFLMDDYYAQVGSANLDPRSLRLNFELVVELYDAAVVRSLRTHFDEVREASREVTLETLRRRSLPAKLRDAVFWLFSPYL
ncbi:MAG: phospholipase D-like domain-containing protein [Nevskiaceae bacterium]